MRKWTYDTCAEEAKKYSTRTDFYNGNRSAYHYAWKNGYLDDFTWFVSPQKPHGYWDYDTCYEEAKKYSYKAEFKNNCGRAYHVANKNGWLKDYTWMHKPDSTKKWTYEACYEEAKKYKSKSEFLYGASGAYGSAIKNGWLKDYTWFIKPIHKKDDYWVYSYEDLENKVVYVGLTWRKKRHTEHRRTKDTVKKYFGNKIPNQKVLITELSGEDASYYEDWYKIRYKEDGWSVLNKAKTGVGSSSLGSSNYKWNHETCYDAAKKCCSRSEFALKYDGASRLARRMGWFDEYTWFKELKKPNNYWTYDACYEEAKKYKSRKELEDNNGAVYKKVTENGWIEDYIWFKPITQKPHGYWTYERCKDEASKYNRRLEFRKGNSGAYMRSYLNGWLDEFFPKAA